MMGNCPQKLAEGFQSPSSGEQVMMKKWGIMNLEEAIVWFRNQQSKKKASDPDEIAKGMNRGLSDLEAKIKATAESVNAQADMLAKKLEWQIQEEKEMIREGLYPTEIREVKSGYRGAIRAQYTTAQMVTSMAYPANIPYSVADVRVNGMSMREQLEKEYQVKLKAEVERVKREIRGESGDAVEVNILQSGRKFKLEGE